MASPSFVIANEVKQSMTPHFDGQLANIPQKCSRVTLHRPIPNGPALGQEFSKYSRSKKTGWADHYL